jgi:hypothetical protein
MQWPDYFPSDCPPKNSKDACDRVYRLIQQDSATADDFLTVRQLYPNRQFPDSDDVTVNRRTGRFKNMKVAVANLTPDSGRIKHTPSPGTKNSHHSWWVPVNVEALTLFEAVDVAE